MVSASMRLRWYKRRDVQEAIVEAAKDKEIAVKFGEKGFGKRPDVIKHEKDILEFAKQGATSFHCSEELWENPLNIVTGMKKQEIDELRIGWDLLLDLDCPILEFSQITASVLIDVLKYYDISNFSVKFSGNHGFHIGVPFQTFPESVKGIPTKNLFPDGPRKIASFLQHRTKKILSDKLLEFYSLSSISKMLNKSSSELLSDGFFDAYKVVDVDTILIAPRHLYRMPYSFNEKSGLVSVPIRNKDIMEFDKSSADFEVVDVNQKFLENIPSSVGEARKLFLQAFDFFEQVQEESKKVESKSFSSDEVFEPVGEKVPEDFFPPCIKKGLLGLVDGKKRFVFVLINFLSSLGWSFEDIEEFIFDWNKRNEDPLRETVIRGQLSHSKKKSSVLPPNCDNEGYMKGMEICVPDNFCKRVKNPVSYSLFKFKDFKKNFEKKGNNVKKKEDSSDDLSS